MKKDEQFRAWLQTQECCQCGDFAEYLESGEKKNHAAHVRHNSGLATKPLFQSVPLCFNCHTLQHSHGHSEFMNMDDWMLAAFGYLRRWLML